MGASCLTAGARAFVAVVDLTEAGCCLFGRGAAFSVGQGVTLQPEGLAPIRGTVRWLKGPLSGVLFDSELYPAVFEHLAKTHPSRLSGLAKLAIESQVDMSAAMQRELTDVIAKAEETCRSRQAASDVFAKRPVLTGSRPGIAKQKTDEKLVRLFLA